MPWPWICLFLVVLYFMRVPARWKYRKIPGPMALPLLGNLLPLMRHGLKDYFTILKAQYGPVFKVWVGPSPLIVIADAQLARGVLSKNTNRQKMPRDLTAQGQQSEVEMSGVFSARDDKWRTLRAAWLPAFSVGSLEGYLPLMDKCTLQLCNTLLGPAAKRGEVIDIWRALGKMTLQVVGSTAYGVDFQTLGETSSPEADELIKACQAIFKYTGLLNGSVYEALGAIFPEIRGALCIWARTFPDEPLRKLMEARMVIRKRCLSLIEDWKTTHDAADKDPVDNTRGPSRMTTRGVPAVQPGSFLDLLLGVRDKTTGERLTDGEVIAQANTFLLAGYETTANALAFTIYCLACNPEAEEKLIQEIDALGAEWEPTTASLEQLPYTEACFNEALRLYPPAGGIREAKADMIVGCWPVPEGSILLVSAQDIHHDPETWPDPDIFNPERFLEGEGSGLVASNQVPGHMPFGGGSRMCIGSRFATQEAKLCLARLYRRFTFRLAAGQVPLETTVVVTLAPKSGIRVTVHERQ